MKNLLLLALALLPAFAQATSIKQPTRPVSRPVVSAQLEILEATGIYASAKEAKVTGLSSDAENFDHFVLAIDGSTMSFDVTSYKRGSCGSITKAVEMVSMTSPLSSAISLKDMLGAACEILVTHLWTIDLTTTNRLTGEVSTLKVGGSPDFIR